MFNVFFIFGFHVEPQLCFMSLWIKKKMRHVPRVRLHEFAPRYNPHYKTIKLFYIITNILLNFSYPLNQRCDK